MVEGTKHSIKVSLNPSKTPDPITSGSKPDHWVDKAGSAFQNPWKSWRTRSFSERLSIIPAIAAFPSPPKNIATILPVREPTWGKGAKSGGKDSTEDGGSDKIKTTWLGHACFLVEFPPRRPSDEGRGVRILFDPVFSNRCSPSQWIGPKRFTPPPCKIEDIPEIDAVVISHNHYDHLDTHTIQTLLKRSERVPHFFAPLGNDGYFKDLGVPASHTHMMDWWDSKRVDVYQSDGEHGFTTRTVDITCTPAQHFTGRWLFDSFKTLWAGWAVEEVLPSAPSADEGEKSHSSRPPVKVYFAGDTGYRSVLDGQDEETAPVCPAFKEIGNRFGGFDCALIPIGAYLPRQFMSQIHCAPQDSVRLFKDVKAKKAIGMHWGTWVLTSEDVVEPPKRLAEECKKVGIEEGAFTVCDIGETLWF